MTPMRDESITYRRFFSIACQTAILRISAETTAELLLATPVIFLNFLLGLLSQDFEFKEVELI